MATAQEKRAAFLLKWLSPDKNERMADSELRQLMQEHVEHVAGAPKASVTTLASAFADIFEAGPDGPPEWSDEEMKSVAAALEKIGRPKAAENLRKAWAERPRREE